MVKSSMFEPLAGGRRAASRKDQGGEWRPVYPVPGDAPAPPAAHPTLGEPAARWAYLTADGDLAAFILRFEPAAGEKEIRPLSWCQHTVSGGCQWRWKGLTVPRLLYGVDRLAARPEAPVLIVEGEACADAAGRLLPDHVAVTSSGGSKAGRKADWTPLAGRQVVVWPDADAAGLGYAGDVARCLMALGAVVTVAVPPEGAGDSWDAADAEAEGWDTARVLALIEAARAASEALRGAHGGGGGTAAAGSGGDRTNGEGGGRKGPPQRDQLIELLGEGEYWHAADSEAFASITIGARVEHWPVRSRDLRLWVAGRFYAATGGAVGGQALEDALRVLESKAVHDGLRHQTWRRIGEHDGAIYVDLVDADRRAVEITGAGWRVVDRGPVKFLRGGAMRPLPVPEAGELIEQLRGFLNVESEDDFRLAVAWLIAAHRSRGPYPMLIINGEQGSAKSTTARVLSALVDPSVAPTRAAPKDERDLAVAADNNHLLSFDNISTMPGWRSDALCRLATGGGFATRKLHSDRDEIITDAARPMLLNGINDLGARSDLSDRALTITLPAISEEVRRTEAEFWADFEAARAGILGALYDAVSCALRRQGEVELPRKLRMADFAVWIEAAAPARSWAVTAVTPSYR